MSQLFLGKHLVNGLWCTRYHELEMSQKPPFVSINQLSARNFTIIYNEDKSTEAALTTNVSLPSPVYVDHPAVDIKLILTNFMETVIWSILMFQIKLPTWVGMLKRYTLHVHGFLG